MPQSSPFSLFEQPRSRRLRAGRPRATRPLRAGVRRSAAGGAPGHEAGRMPTTPPRRRPSGTQHRT
ncbi:hypothetical protein WT08_08580 [Burkholderia sp. MSMB1552]|nr:hypothetical protein WT08_08580 [Burkholderia sp. MSMB1552]KWZ56854.1 hypothetical protein WS92_13770 [Burkholderia sp. MSMB1588]